MPSPSRPRRNSSLRPSRYRRPFALQLEPLEERRLLACVTFSTPSTNGGDGTWVLQQRSGVNVHIGPAYLYYNVDLAASLPDFEAGDTLYAKVNYYDEGQGYLKLQYDSLTDNFDFTEFHSRSSLANTEEFVSSYHVLQNVQFANGGNGNDFRVDTDGAPISTVEICDELFAGSGLDWTANIPWESGYEGPTRDDVDASTLDGKVLAGYQGWFKTPNDRADLNYRHWGQPGDWHVDQWPDPNDYDASELFAVPGVTTGRGDQAYLFSSTEPAVVHRHFQWMREHDIDGVLLQRFSEAFMSKQPNGDYTGPSQWPLVNSRAAAHREGRTWAIEYDIQNAGGQADARIQQVKDDWEFLTDPDGFDLLSDSRYQREDGKPVVAIFGLYVSSNNSYTTAQQTDLINFFKSRGVYVVGAGRHTQAASQIANAGLHDAYIPWQGYWVGQRNSFTPAETILDGVTDHIPHVFPGFSWTHLQDSSNATSVDREDGEFYWRMLSDAANETDAPWWFIGMFDEYDEATNLIPASDDPPTPDLDNGGTPLTFQVSDPMPNDWWLALTGAAKQALQRKVVINDTIPTTSMLENRSNVGGAAHWQVGKADRVDVVDTLDSNPQQVQLNVNGTVSDVVYALEPYLYFQIDDGFVGQEVDGRDITIEVEYLDAQNGEFHVEYSAPTQIVASSPATLTGKVEWRTHRFQLADAVLGNELNGGADFRIHKQGGNLFVRRVRVLKESMLTADTQLGSTNVAHGLTQFDEADGQTQSVFAGGREARVRTDDPSSLYMYFGVDQGFAKEVAAGLNGIIEVTYQDVGTGSLALQYDATGAAYQNAPAHPLTDTGEWRTTRFYLNDALLNDRQNGGGDFRLAGANVPIDRVRILRSFGDLMPPELTTVTAIPDPTMPALTVTWTMTDDWKSGTIDQWTPQEGNRVQIELSDDGGSTWTTLQVINEDGSVSAQSSYDLLTGRTVWDDQVELSTTGLTAGSYELRLVPVDGRDNMGHPSESLPFEVLATPLGDFDRDGDLDGQDLDLLITQIAIGPADPATFDLTDDGLVDLADRDQWLALAGALNLTSGNAYRLGDANLDGVVDGQDFVRWNSHKFTSAAEWTKGDFNADGVVDGQDFIIWNNNKFLSAGLRTGNGATTRQDDQEDVVDPVNELFANLELRGPV
ncbi:MAG: hypothetical protein AAGF97_00165 [Planctomycetota bacterium]